MLVHMRHGLTGIIVALSPHSKWKGFSPLQVFKWINNFGKINVFFESCCKTIVNVFFF